MRANDSGRLRRHVVRRTATLLVVANVIGAGIFTTTGFQAADIGHPLVILGLWLLGGVIAACGALAYGELGAAMPRAGAEYVYLRETYGGAFGFMSAFVSLVAGFSAPIASVAKGLVGYLAPFSPVLAEGRVGPVAVADLAAIGVVWLLVAIQLRGEKSGFRMVDWVTVIKVGGIVTILLAALLVGRGRLAGLVTPSAGFEELGAAGLMTGMATSLIFVMFCYSGWNAAAYIAGELEHPARDLPRSLLQGTGIVVLLYLGMNAVYFYGAPVDELAGRVEVGLIAARNLFGDTGAVLVTAVLCASLLGSATAMTVAGPRVYYALGRDYPTFRFLADTGAGRGVPVTALLLQGLVTSAIILSGRIDQIMQYAGFTLTLFASLAVSCVITLRIRRPEMPRPFRCWGYPWTPLFFLAVSAWMMFWAIRGRPAESLLSLLTVAAGGLVFLLLRPRRLGQLLVILAALGVLTPGGARGQAAEAGLRVQEIAPRVFAVLQPPARRFNESNSLFVERDGGLLVVDTQSSLAATREVIGEIRSHTRLPVRHLILTHWHGDHVQGTAAYREIWPTVEVVGHVSVAEDIRDRAQPRVDEEVKRYDDAIAAARERLRNRVSREGEPLSAEDQRTLADQIDEAAATVAGMKAIPRPFAVPDLAYDGELVLGTGADAIRVKHWRAHTRGDSVVYLPGSGVLATGDVLDDLPYGGHGYPARWVEALEELARLEVRVVVPGHGSLRAGKEHLETVTGLFRSIVAQVSAAVEQGLDLDTARERMDLESYRRRLAGDDPVAGRAWDNFIPATVERAWLEARGELPD